jgi:hypothetical protein
MNTEELNDLKDTPEPINFTDFMDQKAGGAPKVRERRKKIQPAAQGATQPADPAKPQRPQREPKRKPAPAPVREPTPPFKIYFEPVPDVYERRIEEIYKKHKPKKLKEVGKILGKYVGKEHLCYLKICKKYEITPEERYMGDITDFSIHDAYHQRIEEIYDINNPEKVKGIDKVLEKYKGREHWIYMMICEKYNLEPEDRYTPGKKYTVSEMYQHRITEIYQEKNPDKIHMIDTFMKRNEGTEHEFYLKICDTYSVKPEHEFKAEHPDHLSNKSLDLDQSAAPKKDDMISMDEEIISEEISDS